MTINNVIGDAIDKNQNTDGHSHLIKSNPLMTGPTLGGVLRLERVRMWAEDNFEGRTKQRQCPYSHRARPG